jgi:thiol-disulfide isomerase/thioredoxin
MRRLVTTLVTAAVVVAVTTGCGGDNWATKCTTNADAVVECTPDQRPAARAVSGELLAGGTYRVADDRGKVVVVNFWGSWCGPCRAEADDLQKTYDATKPKNVAFLGVNWRDDRDAATAFERGRGITYPSVFDPSGKVAVSFEVTQANTPTTLILDRRGRVAVMLRKPTVVSQLQPLVERIAAEDPG